VKRIKLPSRVFWWPQINNESLVPEAEDYLIATTAQWTLSWHHPWNVFALWLLIGGVCTLSSALLVAVTIDCSSQWYNISPFLFSREFHHKLWFRWLVNVLLSKVDVPVGPTVLAIVWYRVAKLPEVVQKRTVKENKLEGTNYEGSWKMQTSLVFF